MQSPFFICNVKKDWWFIAKKPFDTWTILSPSGFWSHQLMVNCWFGARWFGILRVPLSIPIPFIFGDSRNPNHLGPKPTINHCLIPGRKKPSHPNRARVKKLPIFWGKNASHPFNDRGNPYFIGFFEAPMQPNKLVADLFCLYLSSHHSNPNDSVSPKVSGT